MKRAIPLLIVLLLAPLTTLRAADAPISHRVFCTDSKGNRVVILSAKGEIEWEFPAVTLVHSCQPLPDGNVLVAECVTGRIVVVGRDGKVVKEISMKSSPKVVSHQFRGARRTSDGHYWVCQMQVLDVPADATQGEVLR